MQVIADLQIHSKYSRAVSPAMTISGIYEWAKRKGIDLVATGDWTHPLWIKEIQAQLEELGNGFLKLKTSTQKSSATVDTNLLDPMFLLATEVSCIYSQGGKGRRVHTLLWVSTLESALKINREMTKRGCNLLSDGRPIIGLTSIELAELVFSIEPDALIIPAHAWTPWFAVFGSMSGFNSLSDAFGPYADKIYAVETGLSSNPAMNWQIKELDNRSIVSFSDAHSGPKLGREATVFEFEGKSIADFSYKYLTEAIKSPSKNKNSPARIASQSDAGGQPITSINSHIAYTIEFYPEEGKYHFTGHRSCNIRWGPEETRTKGVICPVCGKPLTQGVMQRIEELANRTEAAVSIESKNKNQDLGLHDDIVAYSSKAFPQRPPYIMLVPLQEIIAECLGSPVASKKTQSIYIKLTDHFQGEFNVLLHATKEEIALVSGERIAVGITKVRKGDILIDPGYDGVFGVVKLWRNDEEMPSLDGSTEQLSLL